MIENIFWYSDGFSSNNINHKNLEGSITSFQDNTFYHSEGISKSYHNQNFPERIMETLKFKQKDYLSPKKRKGEVEGRCLQQIVKISNKCLEPIT